MKRIDARRIWVPWVLLPLICAWSFAAEITDQALLNPDSGDWVHYSGTYNSQRHSPLKQVNAGNVSKLQAKWVFHMVGQSHIQAVPIVAGGVMYVSQFNRLDALDARTGNLIWRYQRQPLSTRPQRGTAIYGNMVFVTTDDSVLVALDRRTGAPLWETRPMGDGYEFAGQAPLVANGKVIMSGNQPHGFIQAYEATSGDYLWTWNVIPRPGEPGSETWEGDSWKLGGGPVWVSGSYDPELNTIFYGTGQPGSQWAGEVRKGDNLYTESIVAIDLDSGKLKWHFQNTPHDVRDWDSVEMPVLVDLPFQGQPRKLLLQANRNGFYYVLDRTNGKFLHGVPFVSKINWTSGLTPDGRPLPGPGKPPSVEGSKTCPSTMGATNWPPPAYNPDTKYFYVVAAEGCGINFRRTNQAVPDDAGTYIESPDEGEEWLFYLRALDAITGKKVWDYQHIGSRRYGPGVLSTAGGLIFTAEQRGQLTALDARTGKVLWHFNTGALITSAPISYSVGGQQHIAIISGGNVLAFALPAEVKQ